MRRIDIVSHITLDDHEAVAHLAPAVRELRAEARRIAARLEGRTVWMVNSTEKGGGVAEMLPALVALLRDLGIATEWLVLDSDEPRFFEITKRIHNLIHGVGDPRLGPADREVYEAVNRTNAEVLRALIRPGDILVIHDPQPLPLACYLGGRDVTAIWRCHIGLDDENDATRAAWEFLRPYLSAYRHAVFSAPEYIPSHFSAHATVIYPAIDPLAPKNVDMHLHRLVEVLANSSLAVIPGPVVTPPYEHQAQRLQPNGEWAAAIRPEDMGLLNRPLFVQISRWDRLKGFLPLMRSFAVLKERCRSGERGQDRDALQRRRLELARLVLAGPDAESVQDDPEAVEMLDEMRAEYLDLPVSVQNDIALVSLPMRSAEENAWMVNALQRCATVIAQNSLREGFGLTVTEAMWKHVPVLSNTRACGPRNQVRDGLDGLLVTDPEDTDELAHAMATMLEDPARLHAWGRSAQRRAHDQFMIYAQLTAWGRLVEKLV